MCNSTCAESYKGSYWKKYYNHISCSFAYKLASVDDKFTNPIELYRDKNAAYKLIEAILEEHEYCKRVGKNHFNKHLINTEEEQ